LKLFFLSSAWVSMERFWLLAQTIAKRSLGIPVLMAALPLRAAAPMRLALPLRAAAPMRLADVWRVSGVRV
jgi:hypothetical protein